MKNNDVKKRKRYEAEKPQHFDWEDWKAIVLRVKDDISKDHLQVVAAGVAFYFFLALFPAFSAVVSIYGLLVEPAEVQQQMDQMTRLLPEQAREMLSGILNNIAGKSDSTLGWSLVLSLLFSLWSANKGTTALFEGTNIAYSQLDERGFLKKKAITLLFTLGGIVTGILSMALVVAFPAIVDSIPLPSTISGLINWLRWPLLALIIMLALVLIYKIAPYRSRPRYKWVGWGAVIATLLWLIVSLLFSYYMNNFGNFDKTYGTFTAVIILMLWFFLTAFIILIGAEINSEMEHQTRKDTTTGKEKPMGERNAYFADHVADEVRRKEPKSSTKKQ